MLRRLTKQNKGDRGSQRWSVAFLPREFKKNLADEMTGEQREEGSVRVDIGTSISCRRKCKSQDTKVVRLVCSKSAPLSRGRRGEWRRQGQRGGREPDLKDLIAFYSE